MLSQCSRSLCSGYEAELLQRGQCSFLANFFRDLAIFDSEYCRSSKANLPAGSCGKGADRKVTESRARVRATAVPTAHHIIPFRNKIPHRPEI